MNTRSTLEIRTVDPKTSYRNTVFRWLTMLLLATGSLMIATDLIRLSWMDTGLLFLMVTAGLLTCEAGVRWKRKYPVMGWLPLVPWIVLLLFTGVHSPWIGAKGFGNVIIEQWNAAHENGIPMLPGSQETGDVQAFLMFLFLLDAQFIYYVAMHGNRILAALYGLIWVLVQLFGQCFHAAAGSLLLSGILGLCMIGSPMVITRLKLQGLAFITLVLLVCTIGSPRMEIKSVSQLRTSTEKGLHELCYGKDVLPQGELRKAAMLNQSSKEMLLVRSDQKKNLYLRGFVGETYQNGKWRELSGSAFGGENTGLMKWLYHHGFDPLTQSAAYYQLGSEKETLSPNHLVITTVNASRYYVYAPASLSQIQEEGILRKRDNRLKSYKFTGEGFYELEEISGLKPSEILVAEDWVSNPSTPEQQAYAEAEAVYRRFVHEHDTAIDRSLYHTMYELFWKGYTTENDGIYSAVSYVRKRLSELASYSQEPEEIPDGEEEVQWFLTKSHKGNAVWYASAAVLALRAHGIPARYVEGYYIAGTAGLQNTEEAIHVSGEQAHAWVEIYFDGMGWLPVDVTPGYYYDTVSLQQMVGMPDTVHKTAALQNDPLMAEQITDEEGERPSIPETLKKTVYDVGKITLGCVAFLVIGATWMLSLIELARILFLLIEKKKQKGESAGERARRLQRTICQTLSLWGIEAHLGYQTKETDRKVAQRIEAVSEGDYSRVCELMEKALYGNMELAPYEERTILRFMEKITRPDKSCGIRMWFHLRYRDLMRKKRSTI